MRLICNDKLLLVMHDRGQTSTSVSPPPVRSIIVPYGTGVPMWLVIRQLEPGRSRPMLWSFSEVLRS